MLGYSAEQLQELKARKVILHLDIRRGRDARSMRLLMFVPGNQEKTDREGSYRRRRCLYSGSWRIRAPPAEKTTARNMVSSVIEDFAFGAREVFVRVNSLPTDLTESDIGAVVRPGLRGILLPKSDSADDVRKADALITAAERKAGRRRGIDQTLASSRPRSPSSTPIRSPRLRLVSSASPWVPLRITLWSSGWGAPRKGPIFIIRET